MIKSKIMIVDDEHISLAMTEHILSSTYSVVCASSGADAIRTYFKEEPDMVLSDLRMPGMGGFELQQELQKKAGHPIPFMFMTADKDEGAESKGFEVGAMDFIRKPFRADVLLSRIANILQTVEEIQGLKRAAEIDPMTGLFNKATVQAEVDAVCRHTKGALMMIDLDNFKPVNDIYGHDMGDKILIRFAEIICSAIRESDIAGRMGGDEFVVFCQHITDEEVIASKAKYINDHILSSAREFMGDNMNIPIGASIGCALAPDDGRDFMTLFKKADKALYSVKSGGKHGYEIYHDEESAGSYVEEDATDIGEAITILSERNPARGAMLLPNEQFRLIFQFLTRVNANYQRQMHIVLFSLAGKDERSDPPKNVIDAFAESMAGTLRQSDTITQYGRNQFLLILLKTTPSNAELVIERIMSKWNELEASTSVDVTFEMREML